MEVICKICGTSEGHIELFKAPISRSLAAHFSPLRHITLKVCRHCGVVGIHPTPDLEKLASYYKMLERDDLSDEEIVASERRRKDYNLELINFLEHYLAQSPTSICDYGCGYGTLANELSKRWSATAFGIEYSERAILFASQHYQLNVVSAEPNEIPGNYDLIVCRAVLEHLPDPLSTLIALRDRVSEFGNLLIVVPNLWSFNLGLFSGERLQSIFKLVHLWYFSSVTLQQLVERAGLRVVGQREADGWSRQGELWMVVERVESSEMNHPTSVDTRLVVRELRRKTFYGRVRSIIETRTKNLLGDRLVSKARNVRKRVLRLLSDSSHEQA